METSAAFIYAQCLHFETTGQKPGSNLHAFIFYIKEEIYFCIFKNRKCCCKNKTQKEKNIATDNATKVVLGSKILLTCKVNDYSQLNYYLYAAPKLQYLPLFDKKLGELS